MIRAHLALAAAAILFRPSRDNLRLEGVPEVDLDFCTADRECVRNFAHLAFWACAILLRAAADIARFGRVPLAEAFELCPVRPSIAEIACVSFSTCNRA